MVNQPRVLYPHRPNGPNSSKTSTTIPPLQEVTCRDPTRNLEALPPRSPPDLDPASLYKETRTEIADPADNSYSVTYKRIVGPEFDSIEYEIGQLLANRESREVALKRYRFRLLSIEPLNELRFCEDDIVHIPDTFRMLRTIDNAIKMGLAVPPPLDRVPAIAIHSTREASAFLEEIEKSAFLAANFFRDLKSLVLLPNHSSHRTLLTTGPLLENRCWVPFNFRGNEEIK